MRGNRAEENESYLEAVEQKGQEEINHWASNTEEDIHTTCILGCPKSSYSLLVCFRRRIWKVLKVKTSKHSEFSTFHLKGK